MTVIQMLLDIMIYILIPDGNKLILYQTVKQTTFKAWGLYQVSLVISPLSVVYKGCVDLGRAWLRAGGGQETLVALFLAISLWVSWGD